MSFYENFVHLCVEQERKTGQKVTPSGVAHAIGLSNAAATGWKQGKVPSDPTLHKLADYFEVPVEQLTAVHELPRVGSELEKIIRNISVALDQPYEVLLRIFFEERMPSALNYANLLHFFRYHLHLYPLSYYSDSAIPFDSNDPLTEVSVPASMQSLVSDFQNLTDEERKSVTDYLHFILSQRKSSPEGLGSSNKAFSALRKDI